MKRSPKTPSLRARDAVGHPLYRTRSNRHRPGECVVRLRANPLQRLAWIFGFEV